MTVPRSLAVGIKTVQLHFEIQGYSWILSISISERSPRVFLTTLHQGVFASTPSLISQLSLSLSLEYCRVDFILTLSSSTIDATSLFVNTRPSASISTNAPFALVAFIAYRLPHFYRVARIFLHHRVYSFIIAHSYLHTRGYYKVSLVFTLFNSVVFSRFSANGSIRKLFTSSLRSQT